ncbi:class I SAM-dependent methyltransferase [Ammoniphilus resinae]|uniref:16S rRNA (Guanine1207-N2)-methyltransferase n=1 Tax=Ammoniphilus resinae TaxID=861532 RepID=A0ABS4GR76_9BACL|nr:class I SAM-dependent methyltransferase [Ammoniphilus resinae]MBP1932527.1 16S rRNA (guanine1207-N2)-methyltransferase [Ammoniphilus resinae]
MADHYYTNQPNAKHDIHEFTFVLRGMTYRFKTDAGVFSRDRIDFGSVLLIEQMDIRETDRVLDVGCGYGPVGIVAAKLANRGHVLMADINERAVGLAKENLKNNHIENAAVIVSDLFTEIPNELIYDVVLTNPPIRAGKEVVHQIFEEAYHRLKEGGALWVVIQKKQGAPSAYSKLEETYKTVEKVTQDKGYWIIKAMK